MKEELKDKEGVKETQASSEEEKNRNSDQSEQQDDSAQEQTEGAENGEEDKEEDEKKSSSKTKSLKKALRIIADLEKELTEAKENLNEATEQNLRLQADFENFRKRKIKEQADTIRFSNQELMVNLLPVIDNFERTLKAIEKTDNLTAIKEGIDLVNNSMFKQLNKVGLEPIESIGKEFDSEVHEAISTVPVEDDSKKGMVIDEVEKGYKLKERVIRFSKVIVGE